MANQFAEEGKPAQQLDGAEFKGDTILEVENPHTQLWRVDQRTGQSKPMRFPKYKHQEYPKWRHFPDKPAVLVNSKEEEDELDGEHYDSPNDFPEQNPEDKKGGYDPMAIAKELNRQKTLQHYNSLTENEQTLQQQHQAVHAAKTRASMQPPRKPAKPGEEDEKDS